MRKSQVRFLGDCGVVTSQCYPTIQPITEPFAVKGKQGLFNISVDTFLSNCEIAELIKTEETTIPIPSEDYLKSNAGGREQGATSKSFSSDEWYTPPHISELVIQVLGQITLDPCADEGKHIPAAMHYTASDDGLIKEWNGRVFMNPPYSQPSVWIKKLQAEFESGRVTEAIALVPAATDTKWLSPILKSQPVCFWTGRIKFLDTNYKPRLSARQSHCLVYWGENWERFKEVFDSYGVVYPPASMSVNKNAATQDPVLTINSTISNYEHEETEPVLRVERTSSTPEQEETEPVLRVERTSSTHDQEETEPVLRVERTVSTPDQEETEPVLRVERTSSTHDQEETEPVLRVERTVSTPEQNETASVLMVNPTVSTKRRNRGKGTGRIQIRTITKKNGKQYQQAWYDWQLKSSEKTTSKSTYIPKRLLSQVQMLEAQKAPIKAILQLLGINL